MRWVLLFDRRAGSPAWGVKGTGVYNMWYSLLALVSMRTYMPCTACVSIVLDLLDVPVYVFHVDHIFLNLRGNQSHQCSLAVDRLLRKY